MIQESYPGVYRGVVEVIDDPLNLGRCKIRVPSIHGKLSSSDIDLLPWARYVSPLPTNSNKGMFIIPEVKDIVWVMFEGGDKSFPIYIGSTYGIVNGVSEVPIDYPQETPESLEVLYQSKPVNGMRATIKKTNEYFLVSFGDSFIKINLNGDINLHSTGNIIIEGTKVITVNNDGGD